MKKYLITGGAGFIGSALTKALVVKGFEVKVFDNLSRGAVRRLENIKGQYEFINGDIRDKDAVIKACEGIDSVIHLAFINGTEFFYSRPDLVLEVGVKGIVNILDACLVHNIKDFILSSSSEVYQNVSVIPTPETVPLIIPDPFNPRFSYGGGKIISELLTIHYGKKYFKKAIIFRPHNVYGLDMGWEHVIPQFILRIKDLISKNRNQKEMVFLIQGSGEETRSYIYIDDFIDGLLKVILKGKHLNIYNIGTEEEVAVKDLAEEIAGIYNKKIKIEQSAKLEGSVSRRCPDISKLKKLGFKQKITLKKGLEKVIQWYNHNQHLKVRL